MKYVKTYEGFTSDKNTIIKKLDDFIAAYDEFTKTVSPEYWASSGSFFSKLRSMREHIPNYKGIDTHLDKRMKNKSFDGLEHIFNSVGIDSDTTYKYQKIMLEEDPNSFKFIKDCLHPKIAEEYSHLKNELF